MDIVEQLQQLGIALGGMAFLMLIQILVVDRLRMGAKHVPGTPIDADQESLLLRASRTVANTNESIAAFILVVVFCVLADAYAVHAEYAASGVVA